MKSYMLFMIKVIVSGGLLFLILLKVDWNQYTVSFKHGDFSCLFLGLMLGIGFNMIKFLKWHNLIKAGNQPHSYWDGAKSYMIGNSLGLVTPMRAGELGRSLYFPLKDRSKIVMLTLLDRVMDVCAVLLLSIAGGFLMMNIGFGILVALLAASSFFLIYSPTYLQRIFTIIAPKIRIVRKISALLDILKILDLRTLSASLMLSLVAFVFTILEFYYVVTAFENTSLVSMYLTTPLITLSSLLPVSFMGLGIREGISIVLFSKFGVSAATALSAAFLCFLINNVSISIVGLVFLSKVEFGTKKAKMARMPVYERQFHADSTD